MEKSLTRRMTKKIYFEMINQKTASLIATSCELGAITTSKITQDRLATFQFGENLGMAFQIKEDLFDLLGTEYETGKDSGGDVKKNMMTLPLIYSYDIMSKLERRRLKTLLGSKKKTAKIMQQLKEMVEASGGFKYARQKLDEFSNLLLFFLQKK